jgi:hypothetical protein
VPFLAGRTSPPVDGEAAAVSGAQPWPDELSPFIVVECKAPSISFSEEVVGQATGYARRLGAPYVLVTNGIEAGCWWRPYLLSEDGPEPYPLTELPTYEEVSTGVSHTVRSLPSQPEHLFLVDAPEQRPATTLLHARARGIVGADTPFDLWAPILQLDDLLAWPKAYFLDPHEAFGVEFLEDQGPRFHSPGNPSGGQYPGRYRDFLVRSSAGVIVFGLGLSATLKTENDPRYGTRPGRTLLVVCLAEAGVYHPILECSVETEMRVQPQSIVLTHSGAATVGKGAVPRSTVVDYVATREPRLVGANGRLELGSVPRRSQAEWTDLSDAFGRLARYALLRHSFKNEVRKARKKQGPAE